MHSISRSLPLVIDENLALIKDLDSSMQSTRNYHFSLFMYSISDSVNYWAELSKQLDRGAKKQSKIGRKKVSKKLLQKRKLADLITENKNRLAIGAYDLIDRHVRLIDEELNALDAAILSCGPVPGTAAAIDAPVEDASIQSAAGRQSGIAVANEPLFCVCRRTAFGEMIACDNEDCLIEWFHFPCVGMKRLPQKGNLWYCPDCTASRKHVVAWV